VPLIGFKSHTINPRTGRPEPSYNWRLDRIMNAIVALMCAGSGISAWQEHSRRGASDFAVELLVAAVVFAIIAAARHIMLARARRAYDEAVAAYDAALGNAADWDDAP
jgi:multisubunit Na+/H+ antiporter MnhG subunit